MSIDTIIVYYKQHYAQQVAQHYAQEVSMKNHIEEKILKILSKDRDGVTIADISRHIGVHRNTVSKYIFGLVKEGTVTQRRIGVVSLCYLHENYGKSEQRKKSLKVAL
jgi:Fic family protein